jgi:hypothetical protein
MLARLFDFFSSVDPGLTRLTGLCREPAGAVGREHVCADGPRSAQALCRGPHQNLGKEVILFFSFWVGLISLRVNAFAES